MDRDLVTAFLSSRGQSFQHPMRLSLRGWQEPPQTQDRGGEGGRLPWQRCSLLKGSMSDRPRAAGAHLPSLIPKVSWVEGQGHGGETQDQGRDADEPLPSPTLLTILRPSRSGPGSLLPSQLPASRCRLARSAPATPVP